jgi:hypothetical protein
MSSFVDSKHKKLSEEEIVKIAAKETGGKYTADQNVNPDRFSFFITPLL